MREIFFDEKLGETQRNSEGWEPHGQRWEGWERWELWELWELWEGLGEVGGIRRDE